MQNARIFQPSQSGEEMDKELLEIESAGLEVVEGDVNGGDSADREGGDSPVYMGIDLNYRESSDGDRSTFLITTPNKDRHGTIVDTKGINYTFYKKNPVVKWDHGWDFARGDLPIARTVNLTRGDDGILATIEWWTDEFSQNIRSMVKEKFLQSASIGFMPVKREWVEEGDGTTTLVYKKVELLELSVVAIGSNRESLATQRGFTPAWMRELKEKMDGLEAGIRSGKIFAGIDVAAFAANLDREEDTVANATSPVEAKAEAAPGDSVAAVSSRERAPAVAAKPVPEQPVMLAGAHAAPNASEDATHDGSAAEAKAAAAAIPEGSDRSGIVGRFVQLSIADIERIMTQTAEEAGRAARDELQRRLGRA